MPRYRLLLLELLKNTAPTEAVHPALSAAAEKISNITQHIDRLALRYENAINALKRISGASVCHCFPLLCFFNLLFSYILYLFSICRLRDSCSRTRLYWQKTNGVSTFSFSMICFWRPSPSRRRISERYQRKKQGNTNLPFPSLT